MNYLTTKELNFISALQADYEKRGPQSFFSILFLGQNWLYSKNIENKEILTHLALTDWKAYDPKGYSVLMETNWVMETQESKFIGKYKKWFVGVSLSGEVFGIGQEIQNLPYNIILAQLGTDNIEIVEYYKKNHGVDYCSYIKEYTDFCQNLGLQYKEDIDMINEQSKGLEDWLYE